MYDVPGLLLLRDCKLVMLIETNYSFHPKPMHLVELAFVLVVMKNPMWPHPPTNVS